MNQYLKKSNFILGAVAIISATAYFAWPMIIQAAETTGYEIQIGLPSLPKGSMIKDPAQYIQGFFILGLYLLSFLAVGFIALGGIMWMLAAGNPGRIDKAKEMIVGALSGLVLLLCSYLILNTIDPSLTNIKAPTLEKYDTQKEASQPAAKYEFNK